MGKGHLMYASQPLEVWMADHLKHQGIIDGDESVNRVIDDLANPAGHE